MQISCFEIIVLCEIDSRVKCLIIGSTIPMIDVNVIMQISCFEKKELMDTNRTSDLLGVVSWEHN